MTHSDWLQCFVLNRRAYRETSLMVDCFTRQSGKVRVIAKGVRNSKSDKKSLLQPFQSLNVQLRGRTELKNLAAVESEAPALALKGDGLFCGMYVNELVNRIMPFELPSEPLYQAYEDTLRALCNQSDIEVTLRQFEFAILEEMGVMPALGIDASTGEPLLPASSYRYIEGEGMVFYGANSTSSTFLGEYLLALEQGVWNKQTRLTAKRLNRHILAPLLGEKPLKSRALFAAKKG